MPTQKYFDQAVSDFEKALEHLKKEFSKLQAGRASPALVEDLLVEAYGTRQPLKALASITVPNPKTLQIQPWDRSILGVVEKAILTSNLNLTPFNNGTAIILNIPLLTEERRQELVKLVKQLAEGARVSIRNARQTVHSKFTEMRQKSEITEDDFYLGGKKLQEKVDEFNRKIDELAETKENSLMTI